MDAPIMELMMKFEYTRSILILVRYIIDMSWINVLITDRSCNV